MSLFSKAVYYFRIAGLFAWGVVLSGCEALNSTVTVSLLPIPSPQPTPASPVPVFSTQGPTILGITPPFGSTLGGTRVTITGTGFTPGNTSILIGGAACLFPNFISSTRMTCQTSPNTPGTKTVVLSNAAGQTAQFPSPGPSPAFTFGTGFVYVAAPPILTGTTGLCPPYYTHAASTICPTQGSIGSATAVTITGNNFQQGAIATVGGQICCAIPTTAGQACPSPSPSVNTTTLPNTISCYAPPYPIVDTVPVTVTNPDLQSVTSLDKPFSYGDPINLSYSWNPAFYSLNQPIPTNSPSITAVIPPKYTINPQLPANLNLDATSGFITGTPTAVSPAATYIITASNAKGSVSTLLILGVFDFGTGADNSYTGSTTGAILNSYAAIANATVSGNHFNALFDLFSAFQPGDRVLIIQMQNTPSGSGDPSLPWEFATISNSWTPPSPLPIVSPSPYAVTLTSALTNTYFSGTFNSRSQSLAAQMVRVPQFKNFTLPSGTSVTAPSWNGLRGGIIAFEATGTAQISGTLNAQGIGYRGGPGTVACPSGASSSSSCYSSFTFQGESWNNYPYAPPTPGGSPSPDPTSVNSNKGGGGGGSVNQGEVATGGGGGYGTAGIPGGIPSSGVLLGANGAGGASFGNPSHLFSLANFLLGPGGGGAAVSYPCSSASLLDGTAGGGILFVQALNFLMTQTGLLTAQGTDAQVAPSCGSVSGAGAGGSIYVRSAILALPSAQASPTVGIIASGGARGVVSPGGTSGGTGGDGMIRLDYGAFAAVPSPSPSNLPITIPSPAYNGYP